MTATKYLYNTTFAADSDIKEEVIEWISREFIPSAVDGGYFFASDPSPDILTVLGGEPGVTSIAVHLYTDLIENIQNWYADHGSRLFSYVMDRWCGKVVFFSTTLESLCAD